MSEARKDMMAQLAEARKARKAKEAASDELAQLIIGRTTTKAVERILAAGYVKPRQVKSLAELEALPPESAVQTSDTSDTVVLKGSDGLFINAFGGEVGAETLWSFGAKPFFVIYEPVGSL